MLNEKQKAALNLVLAAPPVPGCACHVGLTAMVDGIAAREKDINTRIASAVAAGDAEGAAKLLTEAQELHVFRNGFLDDPDVKKTVADMSGQRLAGDLGAILSDLLGGSRRRNVGTH
jgi:hypothetical protein